jgi:hypothetical protein
MLISFDQETLHGVCQSSTGNRGEFSNPQLQLIDYKGNKKSFSLWTAGGGRSGAETIKSFYINAL